MWRRGVVVEGVERGEWNEREGRKERGNERESEIEEEKEKDRGRES